MRIFYVSAMPSVPREVKSTDWPDDPLEVSGLKVISESFGWRIFDTEAEAETFAAGGAE